MKTARPHRSCEPRLLGCVRWSTRDWHGGASREHDRPPATDGRQGSYSGDRSSISLECAPRASERRRVTSIIRSGVFLLKPYTIQENSVAPEWPIFDRADLEAGCSPDLQRLPSRWARLLPARAWSANAPLHAHAPRLPVQ